MLLFLLSPTIVVVVVAVSIENGDVGRENVEKRAGDVKIVVVIVVLVAIAPDEKKEEEEVVEFEEAETEENASEQRVGIETHENTETEESALIAGIDRVNTVSQSNAFTVFHLLTRFSLCLSTSPSL